MGVVVDHERSTGAWHARPVEIEEAYYAEQDKLPSLTG